MEKIPEKRDLYQPETSNPLKNGQLDGLPPELRYHDLYPQPSRSFFEHDEPREWIIPGVLTLGEPAVLGGPAKCLKTSVALDLALSIAGGVPFLGRFNINRKWAGMTVAFYSGESGKTTLRETARRIWKAKGTT